MRLQRKQYTSEFKPEAVRLVREHGVSIAQATRDLGINDNLLSRWKKELEAQGRGTFPGQGNTPEDGISTTASGGGSATAPTRD